MTMDLKPEFGTGSKISNPQYSKGYQEYMIQQQKQQRQFIENQQFKFGS